MILEKIKKPNDIHKIPLADFPLLADEIRDYIENNSNSDGTFNFDKERAWVALDFTKKEIGAKNE